MKNDINLNMKILDLCLTHEIEKSNLDIQALSLQVKTRYLQLEYL